MRFRTSAIKLRRVLTLAGGMLLTATAAIGATAPWTQWKVSDGGNGHWYRAVDTGYDMPWSVANSTATADGAYLATLTSTAENTFVFNLINDSTYWTDQSNLHQYLIGPWIGGYYDSDFGWQWVTGEAFSYSNFLPGEPSTNFNQFLHFMAYDGSLNPPLTPTWNDADDNQAEVGRWFLEETDSVPFAVAAPPPVTGLPIDLGGTYLSARNATVGATTDRNGMLAGGMVQELSSIWRYTPFFQTLKKPSVREDLDLRGKSYGFDVDLVDPARWPNPNSLFDWFAGNAADGHEGSTLVIRAASSNGTGKIKLDDMNGLRIMFYRKDGKFFGHVANLWYSEEVPLPGGSVATKYRVKVDVAANGAIHVCFKQMNSAGAGATVIKDLVGGSIENGGLTDAAFAVQMVNVTPAAQVSAAPTMACVNAFWTNAGPNSLYTYSAAPYVSTASSNAPAIFGLFNTNLGQPITAYRASLQLSQVGGSLSFFGGEYENTTRFDAPGGPVFSPNAGGRYDHAQATTNPSHATASDLLLESFNFVAPQGSSNTGPSTLDLIAKYGAGPNKSGFRIGNGSFVNAKLLNSNGVVLDPFAPTLGTFVVKQNGAAVSSLKYGIVDVSIAASDVGSGLADMPLLTATITDNHGVVITRTVRLGSVSPSSGTFGTRLSLPLGTASLDLSACVKDRAGNLSTPSTRTVSVFVPAPPTITIPIKITGLAPGTTVNRIIRFVFGRKGGDGIVGNTCKISINKVITFDSHGKGTVTITMEDGLPEFPSAGINQVWIKDPYHTLGKATGLTLTNSTYKLAGVTTVVLTPGDVTNSNVTDQADYDLFTTLVYGSVSADTTTIGDSSMLIAEGQWNLDLNGDGRFDAADFAILNANFGKVGDPMPVNYFK